MSSMTRFDLPAALKVAKSGDVITLPPGDYGDVRLSAKFDGVVTLKGKGATFRSLFLDGCVGLTLDGASFDWTPTATALDHENAVTVRGGTGVVLSELLLRGRPAIAGDDAGWPIGRGIYVEGASNVTVQRCDVSGFHRGLVGFKAPKLSILLNDIHHNRATTIVVTTAPGLIVRGNHLHSSKPKNYGGSGDHGDFVAVLGVAGDPVWQGLIVADNLLDQGDGDPIMGVMIGQGGGFEDIQITNNVVLGGHTQALLLGKVLSGEVRGNVARRIGGEPKTSPGLLTRDLPAKFAISDNRLGSIVVGPGTKNIPVADGNVYDQSEATPDELAELRAAWIAKYRPAPVAEDARQAEVGDEVVASFVAGGVTYDVVRRAA